MGSIANSTGSFDYRGVWEAIEAERQVRGLNRTQLLRDIDWVSKGVLSRIEQGGPTTCQHITGLLRWLGRSPESFMPGVTDRPEYGLPDTGPFALRWSMPALYEAIDARRLELGMSWREAGDDMGWPTVKALKTIRYGIPMHLAMRITRWLGQPAATYMYAAEPAASSATWVADHPGPDALNK